MHARRTKGTTQVDERRSGRALVVVDVQNGAVALEPYACHEVLANLRALVSACRSAGVEVVHVQHDGEAGEVLLPGTAGWEIHEAVHPEPGEKVVRKRSNSAFRGTDLHGHLTERGIDTLILVGLQTEYCVDTTLRVAFEHGYRVVMPQGTNTTWDNGELTGRQIHDHFNRLIFDGRFASVRPLAETLAAIEAGGPLVP